MCALFSIFDVIVRGYNADCRGSNDPILAQLR